MDSDYIQLVIQNTINSWYYMSFLWTKQIIKRTKMSLMQKCFHQRYYVNFLVSEYLSFNLQSHAPDWWEKNVIDGYFPDFSNQNISNIYNPNKNLSLAFQTKCEIMFSDLGVGSYIFTSCFSQLRTWFIFCFFPYVVIINLLQREEGVGIHCKLMPDWIESNQARLNKIELIMDIISIPIHIEV